MTALRPVRGTHDLIGDDLRRHRHVAELARATASLYGFEGIATPIFEFVDVFKRTLGDASDVVTKEMYAFTDRGGEELVLRPENTAAVVRAIMTNGLTQTLPQKLFYYGPMFRYERPQKGRQRQFHQIGIETLGAAEAAADVEAIALGAHILEELGLGGDRVQLELNTLGDPESRSAYRGALVDYLGAFKDHLSAESLARLERNPLRILDSKDEGDRAIVADAPPVAEYLNDTSRAFFAAVEEGLHRLGIAYQINPRLVRGLDYYTHTTFEFVTTALGAQGTVMAGGRYDGLMAMMGGPDVPGVGWAAGVERLALLLEHAPTDARTTCIIPIGDAAEQEAPLLAQRLRRAGIATDLAFKGKLPARLKRATRLNARFALFLGDDELAASNVRVRDLDSGAEQAVPRDRLSAMLAEGLATPAAGGPA